MRHDNRSLAAVLALVVLPLLAPALRAELRVVATTPEYGALAAAIGAERVQVTSLAKPTEDPHYVDARPSHVVTLNRADLLVEGGADLEAAWLSTLVEGSRNPAILPGAKGRLRAAQGVALLDVPAVLDRSQGDIHAAGNPHFMMDPENARIVARHVADKLCELDAAGCTSYRASLARFETDLDARMKAWRESLAPYAGAALVTYHATWRYFVQRFGLSAELFLEPKPGIPPSPPHLAQVVAAMKERGIRAILVEPFQSRKTAEVVAGHTGARVVSVCQFPGGLPGTAGDYLALMDANVRAIAEGLRAGGTAE